MPHVAPLSIIDFISIIPFYIEVIAKHDTVSNVNTSVDLILSLHVFRPTNLDLLFYDYFDY